MPGPTDIEQLLLEQINETRLDPMAAAARYLTSYSPLVSSDPSIQSSLNYFGVNGPALLQAFSTLASVAPLAWNDSLAAASRTHNGAMIVADMQSHQLPGEASFDQRDQSAGYTGWSNLGENIYAYSLSPLYALAGFMVDWGSGPNGMQNPAGHRENIMSPDFSEVGIGATTENDPNTDVGPLVVTEDFGNRFSNHQFVLGAAYNDDDHDNFYSVGEGLDDLTVQLGASSITTYASGGYTLPTSATGVQTLTFSGGGLAGPAHVVVTFQPHTNIKLDIVDGDTLHTSTSVTVTGPISNIVGLGTIGLTLQDTDTGAHTILGTSAADTINSGPGSDVLSGNGGNDVIRPDAGVDVISGGAGSDFINFNSYLTTADHVDGGTGNDTVYLAGNYAIAPLVFGAATLTSVEQISLAAGFSYSLTTNDANVASGQSLTVNGTALGIGNTLIFDGSHETNGRFVVTSGLSADTLNGGSGNDTLNGGGGNDIIRPGAGVDTVNGGDGNDYVNFGSYLTATDHVDGGRGTDTVYLAGNYAAGLALSAGTLANVEQVSLSAGFSYNLTTDNANVASGQVLTINASALGASDSLVFDGVAESNGRFAITGGAGNDTMSGGTGSDTFSGGTGADSFIYTSAAQSTGSHYDTLSSFDMDADRFDLSPAISGIDAAVSSGALWLSVFDSSLASVIGPGQLQAHHAVLFTPTRGTASVVGHTFLIVDANGTSGYQAGQDFVFLLDSPQHQSNLSSTDFI